jgi:hypothetical protein
MLTFLLRRAVLLKKVLGHLPEYWHDRRLDDVDDEVRDRATLYYLKVFTEKPLEDAYVKDGLFFY